MIKWKFKLLSLLLIPNSTLAFEFQRNETDLDFFFLITRNCK